MGALSPADVKGWGLSAIHSVFQTASGRASTLQRLGDSLDQAHNVLAGWQGEAGDAFRAGVGKIRRDVESDGTESQRVATAVSHAEADVRACKRELDDIERAASAKGWAVTAAWRIDVGDTWVGRDALEFAAEQQVLQDRLIVCEAHAHSADHELATAIDAAVGDVSLGPPAPVGGPAPQGRVPRGKPGTWQDMLLPGAPAGAKPGDATPVPPGAGEQPSLRDLLLPAGESGDQLPSPEKLPDLLSWLGQSAVAGALRRHLSAADVESFKAMVRPAMIRDGVPGDQIEARLNDIVARTQQWIDNGMPNYVPPTPARPPAPGFAEGFGDRWFATEQGIKNLFGQGGPGAPGVLQSWEQMLKGTVEVAQNPAGMAVGEIKDALESPNPAYYAGAKASDGAFALPGMLFGGEGAGIARAGALGDIDAAAGLSPDLPSGHLPIGAGDHPPIGLDNHHNPEPADPPVPDGNTSLGRYAVDNAGHYLPGSLPSYEQLQVITPTEPNSAYYWSGRNAAGVGVGPDGSGIAELIAHGSGGRTLEMTLAEHGVDPLPAWNRHDPVSINFWEDASAAYAENARGEVTAIVGSSLRPGNVWQNIEIPRLMENPNVTRIVQIDPDTGQSVVIFERGK
ncbi:hypothetical protein [Mycobacterium angelicum]|uniref:Uncharacterized protein n=1 Tax=Mycobacterium angelicum TaxID=470074 RepID=A0A1X0A8J2_MYCAN|nr:hypothetical protein [Mycobacterium angelicum]MCV7197424.1 hypothetical protein [Mycobacterium angelicum]ORA26332.1 hypothetical protein BST12_00090 [Mycobacterium angelicum]